MPTTLMPGLEREARFDEGLRREIVSLEAARRRALSEARAQAVLAAAKALRTPAPAAESAVLPAHVFRFD